METENLKCKTCGNIELTIANFDYCKKPDCTLTKIQPRAFPIRHSVRTRKLDSNQRTLTKKTNGQTGTE